MGSFAQRLVLLLLALPFCKQMSRAYGGQKSLFWEPVVKKMISNKQRVTTEVTPEGLLFGVEMNRGKSSVIVVIDQKKDREDFALLDKFHASDPTDTPPAKLDSAPESDAWDKWTKVIKYLKRPSLTQHMAVPPKSSKVSLDARGYRTPNELFVKAGNYFLHETESQTKKEVTMTINGVDLLYLYDVPQKLERAEMLIDKSRRMIHTQTWPDKIGRVILQKLDPKTGEFIAEAYGRTSPGEATPRDVVKQQLDMKRNYVTQLLDEAISAALGLD